MSGSVWNPTGFVGAVNAAQISVTPAGAISSTNVQAALEEISSERVNSRNLRSVFEFMTAAEITAVVNRTPALDVTSAVQDAINSYDSIFFPSGAYHVGPLTIPAACAGVCYEGEGFFHYTQNEQTMFIARDVAQPHIFKLNSGADNVTFRLMRLDGNSTALKCIDATFGAFLTLELVGIYDASGHGVYSRQGLGRYDKCFFRNIGIGLHLYSDSAVSDSELTGGTIPLLIVAGGNQLSNIWANSGTVAQIRLAPFDASTTHINTGMVNVYAGETGNASSSPVIDIAGTVAQKVQQVRITGSHLVHAVSDATINGMVKIDYAQDVIISSTAFLGQGPFATAARYTEYALKTTNSISITLSACVVRWINKNSVNIGVGCNDIKVTDTSFYDCGATIAAGTEGATVLISTGSPILMCADNSFICTTGSVVPYALQGGAATGIMFENNIISYPSATIATTSSGTLIGSYRRNGSVNKMISGTLACASDAWNGSNGSPPLFLGAYSFWVDSSGKLRIKNGAPASDVDGTVVGTQT